MAIEFSGIAPTTFHTREFDGDVDELRRWLVQFNTGIVVRHTTSSGEGAMYYRIPLNHTAFGYPLVVGDFIVVTAFDVHIVTREHLQAFGIAVPTAATV